MIFYTLNNESMNVIIRKRTSWYAGDGDVICGGNVLSSDPLDFEATWKCDKCGKTTKWDQNGLAGIENDLSSRLDDNENDIKVVIFSQSITHFLKSIIVIKIYPDLCMIHFYSTTLRSLKKF